MLKQIKFSEIRQYVAMWESGRKTVESGYGMLMCLGYLRRERLDNEEYSTVIEIEAMIKKDIVEIIARYRDYLEDTTLHEYAKALLVELDEDHVDQFLQLRDEAQMALGRLERYIIEKHVFQTSVTKNARDYFFFKVDSLIVWNEQIARMVQSYAIRPEVMTNPEDYWWLNIPDNKECWIPKEFIRHNMSRILDTVSSLNQEQKEAFRFHMDKYGLWTKEVIRVAD